MIQIIFKPMYKGLAFFLLFLSHWGLCQSIYFESDTLHSNEIIFQDYVVAKATDTLSLFRAIGSPSKATTYKEEEGDVEFAAFHYFYSYDGYDIRLFIADSILYFGNLTITSSDKPLVLGGQEIRVGDTIGKLAQLFPVSYKRYQNASFSFLVYFINDDIKYGYFGSILFEIKDDAIKRIGIGSMIE